MTGATVLTTVPADESLRRRTATLLVQPNLHWRSIDVWKDEPQNVLASVDTEAAVLLFDGIATPEDEVHGRWLDAVAKRHNGTSTLLVDLSGLEQQFGAESERLTARKALWEASPPSVMRRSPSCAYNKRKPPAFLFRCFPPIHYAYT